MVEKIQSNSEKEKIPKVLEKKIKRCVRCGNCCKTTTLLKDCSWLVKVSRIIILLLKYRNIKILYQKPDCLFLKFRDGKAVCLQYARRPQFCRDYYCEKCYEIRRS